MGRVRVLRVQLEHNPFFSRVNFGSPEFDPTPIFPNPNQCICVVFESCRHVATRIASPKQGCQFVLPKLAIPTASVLVIENQRFPLGGGGREVTISGGEPSFAGSFCLEKLDL
ncbi:hypothetical protein TIFTF001_002870 [Ficus carica]|uniref:Uncharacterized protein n=1 Tax=Ficus carica TaxID=3494 RepID=A0AA87ZX20_FICCA|nr:hypothetical protein TIFTF001_002870 [Ficus carica]